MPDALPALRGARRIAAVVRDLAFGMDHRSGAHRASLGHRELGVGRARDPRVGLDA